MSNYCASGLIFLFRVNSYNCSKQEQEPFIGNQAGGRVFLFLGTDDFWRDYNEMISKGIAFVREPKEQDYGIVAVFKDLYGNLWDLVQFKKGHPMYERVK